METTAPSTIRLADGRTLAYAEYGDPDGRPVVAFHGVPGSRLLWSAFDDLAADRGIRLVAPERPGFGHSSFQPGRRLLDWPDDVTALTDHLGIDRFGVTGLSGGGPHAVACVAAIPERLHGVAVASTVTPPETHDRAPAFTRGLFDATRYVPGFSRSVFETAGWLARNSPSSFRAGLLSTAGQPDRDLFEEPVGELLLRDAIEGFHQGGRGAAHDFPLLAEDWGIDFGALDVPITLFHGRNDETVALALARAFGDLLPAVDLHVTDGAHYSTLVHNAAAILEAAAE